MPVPLLLRFLLYLDEDSHSNLVAALLVREGLDVLRSTDAAMDGQSDEQQLAFATNCGRVVYTANIRDFRKLSRDRQRTGLSHGGLILWEQSRLSAAEQARRILRIWETVSAADMVNREEFLSQWGEPAER
jgi:hypothetical protein